MVLRDRGSVKFEKQELLGTLNVSMEVKEYQSNILATVNFSLEQKFDPVASCGV